VEGFSGWWVDGLLIEMEASIANVGTPAKQDYPNMANYMAAAVPKNPLHSRLPFKLTSRSGPLAMEGVEYTKER
jgi:hypothetical protein